MWAHDYVGKRSNVGGYLGLGQLELPPHLLDDVVLEERAHVGVPALLVERGAHAPHGVHLLRQRHVHLAQRADIVAA